ncbi:MAG: NUDIX hydrolase [Nanobdellota archaeon]
MKRRLRTAGMLIECKEEILILKRNPDKKQGSKWGLPAGKVGEGESDKEAVIREVKEETGFDVDPKDVSPVNDLTWHFPEIIVEFPTFRISLEQKFEVKLNPDEHEDYEWITPEECYKRDDLIHGFHDLLEKVYDINHQR